MFNKIRIIASEGDNFNQISSFYESLSNERLQEIDVNPKEVQNLTEIEVEAFIDATSFDFQLIPTLNSLAEVLRGFLELFVVCKNAVVSLEDIKINYGIRKILITAVDFNSNQGSVTHETRVKVKNVRVWPRFSYETLAGVQEVAEKVKSLMKISDQKIKTQKILLIGPSGTGKSTLIRNLSLETNAFLFEITSSDVVKSFPGDTEACLREIFNKASALTTVFNEKLSIIMIKNIELLCPKEVDPKDTAHVSRISSQVMRLLENLEKNIIVVVTTSNIEGVDLRLRRAGRIDEEIFLKMPDFVQREAILRVLLPSVMPQKVVEGLVKDLAFRTNGYVGSDFALMTKHLMRHKLKTSFDENDVTKWDFFISEVLKKVTPSSTKGEFESRLLLEKGFESIGGMENLKSTVRTSILGPLRNPEAFARFNLSPPRGILLYGPPGCAKTTFARCIAAETKMTFFATSAAEIYSPYVGKAEKYLVKLFNQARISAPSIIFLDEIDALVGSRNQSSSNDVQSRILSTLLTEMDGIGASKQANSQLISKQILIIAATNRPDMIDDALMRPGRFDKLIHVPAPDEKGRFAILETVKLRIPFEENVDFGKLAAETDGFSGADMINLCNEAALVSATRDLTTERVTQADLEEAGRSVRPSLTENQIKSYYEFENRVKGTFKGG
ncbi:ATPase family gene 2 protein homolog B [Culicoides brevitarsis]|uniref:ATPase family gene 2 protein homolog B n=1 Tax=Culicoides brevitarsis TaxID=469753 RepID=UPI00307B12FE